MRYLTAIRNLPAIAVNAMLLGVAALEVAQGHGATVLVLWYASYIVTVRGVRTATLKFTEATNA